MQFSKRLPIVGAVIFLGLGAVVLNIQPAVADNTAANSPVSAQSVTPAPTTGRPDRERPTRSPRPSHRQRGSHQRSEASRCVLHALGRGVSNRDLRAICPYMSLLTAG